jgi:hypothetical protein
MRPLARSAAAERLQDLDLGRAAGRHELPRCFPVSGCGVGRAQLARVQRGELAQQLEVGTAVREQRFECLRALRVQSELALERLALTQCIGREDPLRRAQRARDRSRPLRARALSVRDGSARAPRPGPHRPAARGRAAAARADRSRGVRA